MEEKKQNGDEKRREYWRRHIDGCRESGLSYAEYARGHDLKESAFSYWRRRLSDSSGEKSGFVELKVSTRKTEGVEIVLRNQIRISVGTDFDEAVLRKLIGVLESI